MKKREEKNYVTNFDILKLKRISRDDECRYWIRKRVNKQYKCLFLSHSALSCNWKFQHFFISIILALFCIEIWRKYLIQNNRFELTKSANCLNFDSRFNVSKNIISSFENLPFSSWIIVKMFQKKLKQIESNLMLCENKKKTQRSNFQARNIIVRIKQNEQ